MDREIQQIESFRASEIIKNNLHDFVDITGKSLIKKPNLKENKYWQQSCGKDIFDVVSFNIDLKLWWSKDKVGRDAEYTRLCKDAIVMNTINNDNLNKSMGKRVIYNINREPVKEKLPLFELVDTDDVFKDDLNKDIKDLINEAHDANTAFKTALGCFIISFIFNVILISIIK